jgi:hypothetical protein
MEQGLIDALPYIMKYAPGAIADITAALQKKGYTVAQIGAIYSQVVEYDQLGINPNAPVKPEPAPAVKAF